jgi:L-lactate dehydrogenase complex protein LldE
MAAVCLLEAAGCDVDFPEGQTCCGQPAVNSGDPEAAAVLARHFVEVFEPYEAVVTPSGSCAAMVRHWFPQVLDGAWRDRAVEVAGRTWELGQYLVDVLGRLDVGARVAEAAGPVTVHDACHGLRVLGCRDAPRRLLEEAGVQVVEMPEPEVCCGFGGTFAAKHGEISGPMADDKLAQAAGTGAACLVSGDAGCLLHLEGRRARTGVGPPCLHWADVLAGGLP